MAKFIRRLLPKSPSAISAFAIASLILGLSAAGAQAQKTGTVKFGLNESLSGNFSAIGYSTGNAIRMAVKEINDKGGFKVGDTTYKIDLIEVDNQSNTASAVAGMTKLVEDDKVKFVYGPLVSPLATQTEQITVPAHVIHFSGATSWQVSGDLSNPDKPLLFGTQMMVDQISRIDASAFKELGVKKVVLMSQDDDVAKAVVPPEQAAEKAVGIDTSVVLFPVGTADYSAYVTRAKADGAQAIYFHFPQAVAPQLLRYVVDLGAAPMGFGGRNLDPAMAIKTAIGKPVPMPFFTTGNTPSFDYPPNDKVKAYVERLKAFAPNMPGPTASLSFMAYDFVPMLVEAMKRAGTVDDTAKIGDALTSMTYAGVIGNACFSKNLRNVTLDGGLVFVRDGKIESKEFPSSCK